MTELLESKKAQKFLVDYIQLYIVWDLIFVTMINRASLTSRGFCAKTLINNLNHLPVMYNLLLLWCFFWEGWRSFDFFEIFALVFFVFVFWGGIFFLI